MLINNKTNMKKGKIALILLLLGLITNLQIKAQTTFYSQSNGLWNNTGNWNSAANGSGTWAVAADLTNGLQNFTVQSGHTVTVNDSVNIGTLTVAGTFVLGDNTTTRYPKINNGLTIDSGGAITTGAFNTTHILTLTGGLTNNGNLDFKNNSAQATNILLSGTQTISGTGTFQFNNFQTTAGTITAGVGLNIDGALIVNTGTTFAAGSYTHSIAGTFTRNGTFTQGTSTIVLDGAMAQSVTTAVTFNNLQISGGGVAILSAGVIVNGNFSVSNNSTVNTDATHTFLKDFTIADGSLFKATDGEVNFNGTTAQNISLGTSNAIFDRVYFDGAGLKTFTGNLTANDYSIINSTATIVDNTDTWTHTFSNGLRVDGLCNLTSDIVLKGGNYRKGATDNTSPALFRLGNGADVIVDGGVWVIGGDSMMVTGNLTINTGYIVLQYLARTVPGDTVDSRLIGQAGNTLTVASNANLYMRGKNNFPQGFDSYNFANGSNQIYDAQFNQTIRGGITFGYLHLSNYIKTADGAINVANNLYLSSPNIDSMQFNMGNYSHTISGSIIDNYDATQPTRRCNILSTGTVTMNAPNANQYIYERTVGNYRFNNLSFTNSAPTTTIVKGIFGDVFVSGNFDLSNSSSNELLYMGFDIDDAVIHGGNQFNIGNNVEYRTNGTASFKSTLVSFTSVNLHANSTVRFDGADQTIPGGIHYGNLYLYGNGIKTLESSIHIHGNINDMGYTPIFTVPSGGLAINIAGDWLLETNYVNMNADGSVTFDGADQMINTTTLPNVSLQGTGTKTLNGNLTILGDLSLSNGIEFNADNRYITISGDWDNNSTATFHQLFGRTTFVGTSAQNIAVLNSTTSKFYDLYLDKPTGDTLYLLSDVAVERNTFMTENRGNIHINNHSLSIGGDLWVYDGCKILYSAGGTIKFNGSTEEQLVRNYNENMIYPDLFFSGAAVKRLYDNAYYINGNFNIDHTTVNAEYFMLYIKGNWVNSGGTFTHNSTVIFDGGNQNIDASSFSSVKIAGTGVKKLYGNISLSSWLRIDTLATLDASPDAGLTNYNITLSGDWFNNEWNASRTATGTFIPRQGTVTFSGNWGNIYTGDSINASGVGRVGKQFYNVIVNNTDNNYYTLLYPINVANVKTEGNDLRVLNDFTVNNGIFYTYWNKLYVGGDFKNTNGSFQMNEHYGQNSTLTLEGTTGNTFEFNPGAIQYFRKTVINGGAKYNLTDALTINGANGSLTITNGELNLNHNLVTLTSPAVGDVIVEQNGKISLDSAAILTLPNLRYFRNLGGSINLLGNSNTPAKVTSSGTFYFIQDSGQFAANYYFIENTRGNGLELKSGTLHATNNLSNGMFSGATQTAMLTLNGFNLGTDITVDNVFFNNGPTYNVQRNTGTDTITFSNAKGTYSGESYDDDLTGLVVWSASTGKTWDGGGDAINWNDANNWQPNGVPDSLTNVYIDHSLYAPIINISVNTAKAYAKSISIEKGSAASKITLNGSPLQVHGDLTIKTGAALEQTNPTDSLILKGNWLSAGTYTCHTAPVIFKLASGTYNLSVADTVYRMFVTGTNGKISLNRNLIVKDSLVLNGGTLATTSYGIYLKGDWTVDGGIFTPGTGTVYFQGTNAAQTQYISGGEFNNIEFGYASPKEIRTNITVNGNFTINNNASVDGKTAYIFLKGSWLNDVGESGFDQTGGGTVVFNGTVGVNIGVAAGNKTTLFNNILIQGNGTKYVRDTIKLNGNIEILTGANLYLNSGTQVLGTGTSNSLLMTGGTLYLLGENNFPQNIENIDLAGGLVDYYSNMNQSIYPTTYFDLRVRRDAIGSNSTKTLLGNIKLLNSLYIYDIETLLDVAGYQITLTGGIGFPTGGRQIAWNGGSLIQIGTGWSIDPDITILNNLTKRGSGWVTLNHDLDITGNVVFYDETYLNQNTFRMDCSVPGNSFSMGSGGIIYSYVAKTTGAAFPLGFSSYLLDENTITYIRGTANQEIFTGVTYGNLYLSDNATRTVEINANLRVNGNFIMSYDGIQLLDKGHDIYLGGLTNQFRNYTATNTLHFTKAGNQNITAEGVYNTLNFNQIEVSGSGTKEFNETTIDINGQLIINAGATFSTNDNVYFSGDTLTNHGSLIHYGNLFTFDGAKQYVDPGADNDIYGLSISANDTVSIALHGLDVNNGLFAIANNALLNMGSLTHTIAAVSIDKTGTGNWNVADANLVFDRNGDQYIPALTAKDITFSTSSSKYLRGHISVDDLTIQPAVRLRSAQVSTNTYNITLTGNWLNQGYTDLYDDTVFFESNAVDSKTITSNGAYFNIIRFNKTNTEHRTYSLSDNMIFYGNMFIGNNATLNLNNNSLTIGNDDANSSVVPYVPTGESITIETGGELYINGGASLMFNHYDADPSLNVYGKLSVLGSPGINANVTRSGGYDTRGTAITIYSGGTIAAENYHFQYLSHDGLVVQTGATVDDVHNFSNGIWSNIYQYTQHNSPVDNITVIDTFIYLTLNATSVVNPIANVTFNHSATPTVNRHFNVRRSSGLINVVSFAGSINGSMGASTYEMDPDNLINWPAVSQLIWNGSQSSDWFVAANWTPSGVPSKLISVRIPLAGNNPVIYKEGAECAKLEITNGILGIEIGADSLAVNGTLLIGSDGVLAIEDNAELKVSGDWNIANDGLFVPKNGLVTFRAPSGSVVIDSRNSVFNHVTFNGGASFFMEGILNTFNGNLNILKGQLIPNDNNYTYTVKGNFNINGGSYSATSNTGFVDFRGTAQTINNGNFNRVQFSNSGSKTITGTFNTTYENGNALYSTIIVADNATMTAGAGCSLNIKGNMLVNANATFNDGNQNHSFSGRYWTGTGNYVGNGTVEFNGTTQSIYASKFNNLTLSNQSIGDTYKYLLGNVSLTGNLTLNAYYFDVDAYQITGNGGTFAQTGTSRIYVRGADNYPKNFATYNPAATTYAFYTGATDQVIREATYGNLYLNSTTTKTLEDAIVVRGLLYFYDNGVTLNAANNTINIEGSWYNQYSGIFIPGTGEVVFDGTAGNQYIYLGSSVVNPFYKLTVDKTPTTSSVVFSGHDAIIQNDLLVHSGIFTVYNGYTATVSGNLTAQNNGTISNSGTYLLNKASGTGTIKTNGSTLNHLTINTNGTYNLTDNLTLDGNFTLEHGIFSQNGFRASLGNYYDVVSVYGEYQVTAGGSLLLGDQTTFGVKTGGIIKVVGTTNNYASVSNRTGRYYFNVESGATIHAKYYNFAYMRSSGIKVNSGASIDATNNFSFGSFSNPIAAGTCLNIENNQEIIGVGVGSRMEGISFPDNPGSGAVNVRKDYATAGQIELFNATGLLSGQNYESDPSNLIFWTGDVVLTWTGAVSSNWFTTANWSSSSGASIIPDQSSTVVIPTGTSNFPIINGDSAFAKTITIDANAFLFVNNPSAAATSLFVMDNIQINGTFSMTNATDTMEIYGNWSRGNNGSFTPGNGSVVFSGVGSKSIQNRNSKFNHLNINNNGTVQTLSNLEVLGNFTISTGSFDVTTSNRILTIGGNYSNLGTFTAQSGLVIFNGTGSKTLDPGTSAFYDLEIVTGNYSLTNHNLSINRNFDITGGSLTLSGLTLYMGDDSGSDDLTINGDLLVGNDGILRLGNNATLNVGAGGLLSLKGTDNHEATITHRTTGRYSFIVGSGGELQADYYKIDYLNATGLWFQSGSVLAKDTFNLSNGSFSEGIAGGQYIWFENNYTNDDDSVCIANIYFNQGATYNAKRDNAATNGIIKFKDAEGVVSGYYFELDNLAAGTGSIVWRYTDPILTWKGGNISGSDTDGTRWDNALNWEDQSSAPGVPSASTKVFVNDVSAASNKYPVLNDGSDVTIRSLTIYSGASLTIGGGKNLTVTKDLIFTGTLQVSSGSASTIYVGGQFSNGGVFTHGGASTLFWATTDNNTITSNGSAFYNLTLNSGGDGSGHAIFTTGSSLTVLGNFSLVAGTLTVANTAHQLAIKGNFSNQGTFNHGNGTVLLDGSAAQNISSTTALKFYNLQNDGTGAKNLLSDIEIQGKLTNNSVFNASTYNILIKGDWAGSGTYTGGAGNVVFGGTASQRITKNETFTNLVINNTAATNPISLNGIVTVSGQLTLTDGLITTSTSKYIQMNSSATLSGGSANCYVNGLIRKVGSADFLFPIGSSDQYAPLEITGLGTSSDFSAQYFDVAPTNRTNLQVGLNAVSNAEYWNLTRNSGASTPRVTLYWNDKTFSGIDDLDVLSVALYNSTTSLWENYGVSSVAATPDHSAGHIISNLTFSQFGKITFGFVYPTITWIPGNGSASFTDNANWTGTVVPTEQANITIPNIAGGTYPIVSSLSQKTYNVTIEAGGVLAIADNYNLDVYGTFTLANTGRLILGTNSSINLYQDFTSTGRITCGTNSTVKFSGSTTQNIVFDTCYNTIFNGSGTKNLSSDIVVLGSVNTTNNVNAGSHTITVFGNWTTSGTFNAGTSTVILKGTGTQTITEPSAGGFYNLVINNSSATVPQITLGGYVLVNGNLTLTDGIVNSTATKMLRVGNTGTASNGSDSSYIQGVLYKYGITDFVFPIGTNSILARIGISGMTGAGNFSASYFASPHSDLTHKVIGLDRVSGIEYWDLSRPSGTATPYVTLHWADSSRSQIQNHSQIRVSHYTSGSWQNMGNGTSTINTDSSGFVKSSVTFTTFSPVTLGSADASNPLPIELISFDAVQLNSNVLVSWTTLSETMNDYFTLERSTDRETFNAITQISGAGTSTIENHYQFVDKYVSSGVYYYRLKQTDNNGEYTYSNEVSVDVFNQFVSTLTVYPNPCVNSNINISYFDRENLPIEIKIIDILGKILFIKEYQLIDGYLLTNLENECNLMPGTYYMILSNKQKIQQVQFSIVHN